MQNKCVFLDRDGVINREIGDYVYRLDDFELISGVVETIERLKKNEFVLVIVTNQAGVSKGLFTEKEVMMCYQFIQESCNHLIDEIYYCPYHPSYSNSLCRKPDSLMFEKAIAKFNIDTSLSWMIGDTERDLVPARKLGIRTIQVGDQPTSTYADYHKNDLKTAAKIIIK